MLPEGYDQFFLATATVAGALIGLLFVAISVRPQAAARAAHATTRLRALTALSAFLDTLLLSLLALRPRPELGGTSVTLGAIGLAAMATLLVMIGFERRDRWWPRLRGAVLVAGQAVIYLLQVLDGVALTARSGDVDAVDNLAILVVVLFALGIARAWEFAGADNPSLLGTAVSTALGRSPAEPGESEAGEPEPGEPEPGEPEPGEGPRPSS